MEKEKLMTKKKTRSIIWEASSDNVPFVDYNIIPSQLEMEMLSLLISSILVAANIFKCRFVTTADVNFSICNTQTVMCWPV